MDGRFAFFVSAIILLLMSKSQTEIKASDLFANNMVSRRDKPIA